ncbi:MAG: dTMP kinase [Proteobacteria bacterium]|nr:dTMP kinase [Pseudomonadota bacterium]
MTGARGLFLAFEGIDGAGKTTHAQALKARLEGIGHPVRYVKEPTEGPWGQKVRAIAREGRQGISLDDELEWFIRDREDDVRLNIAPALARGDVVIADRYFYSTIAYQSALGLDPDDIRRRNAAFPVPDLVFLIEISTPLSQVRIVQNRGEAANPGYEQESYLVRVKRRFDEMTDPNIVRLDGDQDRDTLSEAIWSRVRDLLDRPDA